jgi:hypothetical protein
VSLQNDAAASEVLPESSHMPHLLARPVRLRTAEVALWFIEPGPFEARVTEKSGVSSVTRG